jgi:hypothetical protein
VRLDGFALEFRMRLRERGGQVRVQVPKSIHIERSRVRMRDGRKANRPGQPLGSSFGKGDGSGGIGSWQGRAVAHGAAEHKDHEHHAHAAEQQEQPAHWDEHAFAS